MSGESAGANIDHVIHLLGRPTLADMLVFLQERTTGVWDGSAELAEAWYRAKQRISELEQEEGVVLDATASIEPLPADLRDRAQATLKSSISQNAFRAGPEAWRIVNIDDLVVYQKTVNLRIVEEITTALPRSFTAPTLFDLAVGDHAMPGEIACSHKDRRTFWFTSKSADARFLDVKLLTSHEELKQWGSVGAVQALVGVAVGFGRNFISAVGINGRLLLINGTHRLYALRQRGVTQIPCLVSEVETPETAALLLPPEVTNHLSEFLERPRPPLFKDYFDSVLRVIVPTTRIVRVLRLELALHEERLPVST